MKEREKERKRKEKQRKNERKGGEKKRKIKGSDLRLNSTSIGASPSRPLAAEYHQKSSLGGMLSEKRERWRGT